MKARLQSAAPKGSIMAIKVCPVCAKDFVRHGLAIFCGDPCERKSRRSYMNEFARKPEQKAKRQAYASSDKYKEARRKHCKTQKYKETRRAQNAKEITKSTQRAYDQTEKRKAWRCNYESRPERKEKIAAWVANQISTGAAMENTRKYRARKHIRLLEQITKGLQNEKFS